MAPVFWAVLALSAASSARAGESASPHYSNVSFGTGEAASAPKTRAPRRVEPAPQPAPAAPAAPSPPPAPPWAATALGAAAVFAAAALWRRRESRRDDAAGETLALAAHELKSPLAAIESYLDLMALESAGDTRDARRWLSDVRHMKSTAAHLRRTIADILDMTRIEDGRIKLAPRALDPAPILAGSAAAYRARAAERGVTLVVRPESPEVRADPDRLRQVLDNLIGNALKFTPAGKSVTVDARRDGGRVVIEVRDAGVGVPAGKRDRLFAKFARLAPALDGTEGTGLGLYISRRLVEAQGGRLDYAPAPGEGSVFRITLPGGRT